MESLIAQAQDHEARHLWHEACDVYRKIIDQSSEAASRRVDVTEKLGYALYRWARQAESGEEFKARIEGAIRVYEQAYNLQGSDDTASKAGSFRCQAMLAYLKSRASSDPAEKKLLVSEAWELTKKSLEILAHLEKAAEYGRTYNELAEAALHLANLEREYSAEERVLMDAFELGEKSVRLLIGESPLELSRSYVLTAGWMDGIGYTILRDPEEQNRYHQNAKNYWKKALQISEETALLNLAGGGPDLGLGSDESLDTLGKALDYARKTGDRQFLGATLEGLSMHTSWKALGSENPEDSVRLLKQALQYAEDARKEYDALSYTSWAPPVLWTASPYADYYRLLARYETDIGKRRGLLEKSLETAPDQLKRAIDSGYTYAITTALHVFTNALTSLASIERDPKRKMKLLEEALRHSNEYILIIERLEPYNYWNRGEGQDKISNIKSELASLSDEQQAARLLQEAIQAKEASLKLGDDALRWVESAGSAGLITQIASKKFEYGDLLIRWRSHEDNYGTLRNASKAFEDAAKLHEKAGLPSRVAESYWRAAQAYDLLEDSHKASDAFLQASNNYKAAAQKLPQLEGFYEDHSTYMRAWSEIELARYHHGRQEHRLAKDDYEKAAELHRFAKPWSYLAQNYSAWADLENGEDLSRNEKSAEAVEAFERASELFAHSRATIQHQLGQIKDAAESQMAEKLVRASELRRDYCNGRITLEEAKLLDKRGDHLTSSEKFGHASEILSKIAQSLESEKERQEFKLISTISNAWGLMARAEAEDSPNLYAEASKLFEDARSLSPTEKSKTLALGHSRFCRALEAGTKFAETKDPELRMHATESLDSAAYYYLRADEPNASEYARATKLLLEAHSYMDDAGKEKNLERKSSLYLIAENLLKASILSFSKADHPEKEGQVRRLLEKARQDRDLAVFISLAFQTPPILSDTATFSTPKPTHERAVGLDRFEHADVQTRFRTERKELNVGEDLGIELELTNAGRGPAQLVRIEEAIPKGFQPKEVPISYRVEGSSLNLKGKRLDPLKVEEVRLVLAPTRRGRFTLTPRLVYLDESGRYKSHETGGVDIIVKELGIARWIKGPG